MATYANHGDHRAERNRTIVLDEPERIRLRKRLVIDPRSVPPHGLVDTTINGDCFQWAAAVAPSSVDLLILDPPYNLTKDFNGTKFTKRSVDDYTEWLGQTLVTFKPLLAPTATVYILGDWLTSVSIFRVAETHFHVRNRITWEREKGRGAKSNWKCSCEDIWFCTMSNEYVFNVDQVKLRRKVMAPYTLGDGTPKDWARTEFGGLRDTHPSNIWTDITVPFWSMRENTDHPTQKSEKLLARLVLASSNAGDLVLDPFLGSGTTSVVAKKLRRHYLGIEINEEYCLLAERRLEIADSSEEIQGYTDGIFWDRNTPPAQRRPRSARPAAELFADCRQ